MTTLYPIGIQSFPDLIKDGFAYVDKTALVYKLTHTFRGCFLSRPRRFGKSLLMSTIEAYFKGEKDLFRGLAIEKLEKEWLSYPVIHFDLNNGDYRNSEKLEEALGNQLAVLEQAFGVEKVFNPLGDRFENLIRQVYLEAQQRVVVLIDEYDKPMLEVMTDEKAQKRYREVLKPFYGTLKKMERCIKFIMVTGVTKFAKLSVFSDLNQLKDISLLPTYSTICGITRQEMLDTLSEGLQDFAEVKGWSIDKLVDELERKYDGYHFSENSLGVLNPFSLLNAIQDQKLIDYWFQTGTPNFLADLLHKHHTPLPSLEGIKAEASVLTSVESMTFSPVPVIYQSGYLTIKGYDDARSTYTLGYPNEEVEQGFLHFLLPSYTHLNGQSSKIEVDELVDEIRDGKAEAFLQRLESILAGCNYDLVLEREAHYQNVLYILFTLIGLQVEAEKRISAGRIDLVLKTHRYVYIMEFKYEGTAKEALQQIIDKEYALPYRFDSRKVILVAVNFEAERRNLSPDWIIQEYQS